MRILTTLLMLVAFVAPAGAQSYQDKKDADAVATIARNLDGLAEDPALFDGRAIPAGADLRAVGELLDKLTMRLDVAGRAFRELSAKGQQRPDVPPLRARFDALTRYRTALAGVYRTAAADADRARRQREQDAAQDRRAAHLQCQAFHEELVKTGDGVRIEQLVDVADGAPTFWQTKEEGEAMLRAIERTAALCKQNDADGACQRSFPGPTKRARYCAAVANGAELMKQGVKNLVAHHSKHSGPLKPEALAGRDGWLPIEGKVSWNEFFSGAALYAQLRARYQPLFDQAGLGKASAVEMFGSLSEQYAALEAKVRELAPTWPLPGKACGGVGCGVAKSWFARAYRGAKLRHLLERDASWKIVKNELGVITHRSKSGHALLQIPGEPLCQLRSWTITESYAGGGRYQASRDVALGYVRWQTCK